MSKQLLFIQGAGEGAYKEDAEVVGSLRHELGVDFEMNYPRMPNEADAPYDEWKSRLTQILSDINEPVSIIGHSVGGSFILKYLSEVKPGKQVTGVFIMAAPFWGGDGWRYEGYEELELPSDLAIALPEGVPVFLYQCQDDEIVPYEHLALYKKLLPQATMRSLSKGGHQFNDELSIIAKDIGDLQSL